MPYDELLKRCIQCGYCLRSCPTYRELGAEMASPRGRIALMRAVAGGELEIGPWFREQMLLCLDCRACESACPSGVEYGRLVEGARALAAERLGGRAFGSVVARVLDRSLSEPRNLLRLAALLRFYQRSGARWLARRSGALRLCGKLGHLEQMLPLIPREPFTKLVPAYSLPEGEPRMRVGMLAGCVMNVAFADASVATHRLLLHCGCEVVVPEGQVCCGALHAHLGDLETAKRMARRNLAAFDRAQVDAVVTNAAGCGSMLKEYGELLADDPQWSARASEFSGRAKDALELLAELGVPPERMRPLPLRVAYDDPCHLRHAQGVSVEPRALLSSIPGLELVELREPEACCGSAGIYSLTHFEMSMRVLDRKMADIERSGAEVVATGNPGCMLQIAYGAHRRGMTGLRVAHPVELFAESCG